MDDYQHDNDMNDILWRKMYCAVSVKDKKNLFNFVLIDEKTKMGA